MTDRFPSNSLSLTDPGSDRVSDRPVADNGDGNSDTPPTWFRGKTNHRQMESGSGSQPSVSEKAERTPVRRRRTPEKSAPSPRRKDAAITGHTNDAAYPDELVHPRAWYVAVWDDIRNLVTGRVKFARLGLLISFSIHFFVLAVLGLWIITRDREKQVEIVAELSEQTQPTEFEEIDLEFNALPDFEPQGQNTLDELPPVTTENLAIDANVKTLLDGDEGPAGDIGGGIALPPQALKKGSFAVWTEPRDPIPKEPYYIIIDVDISTLDKEFKSYPKRDLSGSVIGTDNYEQDFGGRRERGNLPIVNDHVRMKVLVPGAAELVRDTIKVKSNLLNEEQTITIVF